MLSGDNSPRSQETSSSRSFAELYADVRPRLVTALKVAGAGQDAEDFAQEAATRAFPHWERICRGSNPEGYLFTTAFRLMRQRRASLEPIEDSRVPSDPGVAEFVTTGQVVRTTVDGMPPQRRRCVALCGYLGYSYAEAASILGISNVSVRTHLHLARRSLRIALTERSRTETRARSKVVDPLEDRHSPK